MNLNRPFFYALLAIAMLAGTPAARGSLFTNKPEDSGLPWQTVHPYQRNIDWSFSTDPRNKPPHYEGYDDDKLKSSDSVSFTHDVGWYASAPGVGGGSYFGVIGIDNRGGSQELKGTAFFHIDNWDAPLVKHIWVEIEGIELNDASIRYEPVLPLGYSLTGLWKSESEEISQSPFRYRQNIWFEIKPNPPWEIIRFDFKVPANTCAFIDRLHVATECIPEASSLIVWSLLGALATMVAGWRRVTFQSPRA